MRRHETEAVMSSFVFGRHLISFETRDTPGSLTMHPTITPYDYIHA